MSIDISRLSPAAQKQIAEKLLAQEKRIAADAARPRNDGGKYHNQPTERNGIRFDSQKEARRYDELMLMLKDGTIRDLKLQPQFTLHEAYTTPEGKRVQAIRYQADFSFVAKTWKSEWDQAENAWRKVEQDELIVEDVKSKATKTRVYEIKKKLMRDRFGIEITEVE